MGKLIFQTAGIILLILLGLLVLGWVFRIVAFVLSFITGLLLLAAFVYLISLLFKIGKKENTVSASYQVVNYSLPSVPLFISEPSIRELVKSQQQNTLAELSMNGNILELDNNTEVIVLEDNRDKEAVRIRVKHGQHQGKEGWICRSTLQKHEQKLIEGN